MLGRVLWQGITTLMLGCLFHIPQTVEFLKAEHVPPGAVAMSQEHRPVADQVFDGARNIQSEEGEGASPWVPVRSFLRGNAVTIIGTKNDE